MKHLLTLLAFLYCCGTASSAVTLVHFTNGSAPATGSPITLAAGVNTTAGNKLTIVVLLLATSGTSSISSCTDTSSNSYTIKASSLATQAATHYSNLYAEVCTADSIAGGADTVSVAFTTGTTTAAAIALYETTPGVDDQFGPATGNSATPTSASVTAAASSFAIAVGLLDDGFGFGSGWFVAGSGWTLDYEKGGGNGNGYTESKNSSGSVQGTVTSNFGGVTGPWVATIYTIKPAGGAAFVANQSVFGVGTPH